MRKLFFAIAVACVGFFSTSCDKNEDGTPIIPTMNATIDNQEWVAPLPAAVLSNDQLIITGTALNGETVAITVKGKTTGTYELNPLLAKFQFEASYKATLTATTADAYIGTIGNVVISKFDSNAKKVSGTFEFTATNTAVALKQITKGNFTDVSYIVK